MKLISIVLIFFLISAIAFAADSTLPSLSDPYPADGSFIHGGDRTFSINITENNLDASTVKLNIKSRDSEDWDTYNLNCVDRSGTWYCTATVSLDIVGSDTIEQYYFEANDTSGNYGNYGSIGNPLETTIDINPPSITFQNPTNNSWVSSTETITLLVIDSSSGVDSSTVKYSFDNSTWLSVDSDYHADWDTTTYSDGDSVNLYSKASDDLENIKYEWIRTHVDNENPTLTITTPTSTQTLAGIVNLKITVDDSFSGVDASKIKYVIESTERNMDCVVGDTGYLCDEYLDTTKFSDGTYTLTFYAYDIAGNIYEKSTTVSIDNTHATLSITSPNDNSYVKNQIIIYSKITNPSSEITGVKFKWQSSTSSGSWQQMSCDDNYNCTITWDTTSLSEGKYTLKLNATGTMDYTISDQASVTIDNTKPKLYIQQPSGVYVNGIFNPKVIVIDEYLVNPTTIKFELEGTGSGLVSMNCQLQTQGKKYICGGNYNSSIVEDGTYVLRFVAADHAGNSNSTTKEIIVNNLNPTETTTPSDTTETSSDQETTTGTSDTSEKKTTITKTKETINTVIEKVTTEKYIMISIAVLASIGFTLFYLLKKTGKQKIEIEEKEIQ